MPSFSITVTINAPIERVWRALCDPAEVTRWDATVVEALDAPCDYPKPGQHVRWRIAGSDAVLHDRPQHVEPPTRLHSLLSQGRENLDETYTLTAAGDQATVVMCYVMLTYDIPFVGWVIARLRSLRRAREGFEASLHNLKHHCETTH
jgi:uncharacterized protein YndB with AHSA1/START domain